MTYLVDNVMTHIGDPQIAQIAAQLGTSPDQARGAIEHALPLMVGGLAQNTSTAEGADALHNVLGDHAGMDISSILGSMLGGAGGGSNTGGGILGHIFGGNQGAANQGLGHATGLGEQGAGQLMAMLAPIVMAVLAKHVQQGGIDSGSLGGMLGQQSQQMQQQGGLGGLLSAVLGQGGGNPDLSGLGGLLGGSTRRGSA